MLKILNKYKKWLIIFSFAYLYVIAILIAPSGYKAITPGSLDKINDSYQITGINFNNNINTVSVYSYPEITVFQKWIIEKNNRFDVSKKTKVDQELSLKEQRLQGKISHDSSNDNALIAAYTYANKINKEISIEYELKWLTVYYSNNPNLKVGDEILTINGKHINQSSTNSYESFLTNLGLYNTNDPNLIRGERVSTKISFQRKQTELLSTELLENQFIVFYPKYEITKTTPTLENIKKLNVGGPSGGMIQTLAIYSALLDYDYGKIKIAGTGTINSNNNFSVGKIGGLPQKYYTVKKAKADYFIIPESQLNELDKINRNNDKVKVIVVKDFEEVIDKVVNTLKRGD